MLKLFLVCAGGTSVVDQGGQQARLSVGEFAFYDTRRPYEVSCGVDEQPTRVMTFMFPPSLLPLSPSGRKRLTAVRIPPTVGMGDVTAQFLLQLARNVEHYNPAEAARLSTAALEILATRLARELDYPFTDRIAEDERLVAQGQLFDPLTLRLLERAGLVPGMRVLDLGSGAGNVARLAAELVGPHGAVVGVERDPAAVELARRRTDAPNVEFRVGDAQTLDGIEHGFDAVIGRLVLMYLPDPVATLRRAASRLRPGGLLCVHEADLAYLPASPLTPRWAEAHGYFRTALEKAGIECRIGLTLFSLFRVAGLPEPDLLVELAAGGGPDAPAWAWANVISATVPLMELHGIATRADLDPPNLADRLLAETLAADGCVLSPPMFGAWTTIPKP